MPKADYVVGYSTLSEYPQIDRSGRVALHFGEYQGGSQLYVPSIIGRDSQIKLELKTGVGAAGLYVSEEVQKAPFSRDDLLQQMSREGLITPDSNIRIDERTRLAVSYTSTPDATELYVDSVIRAAKSPQYRDKEILLVVQKFEESPDKVLPPNVKLVRFVNTSFPLSRSLIAHSDLPPMVTGDVSMSLALDYGKPFFYEARDWKANAMERVIAALEAKSPRLKKDHSRFHRMLMIPGSYANTSYSESPSVKEVSAVILDQDFQNEFKAAIQRVRGEVSITPRVFQYLQILDDVDLNYFAKSPLKTEIFQEIFAQAKSKQSPELIHAALREIAFTDQNLEKRAIAYNILAASKSGLSEDLVEPLHHLAKLTKGSKAAEGAVEALGIHLARNPQDPKTRLLFFESLQFLSPSANLRLSKQYGLQQYAPPNRCLPGPATDLIRSLVK